MITTSNSPVKGSGMPNQLLGVQLGTLAISGLSRVRTELFQLLVIPSLAPHWATVLFRVMARRLVTPIEPESPCFSSTCPNKFLPGEPISFRFPHVEIGRLLCPVEFSGRPTGGAMPAINCPSTAYFAAHFRRDSVLQFRSCLTLFACLSVIAIPAAHAQFNCPAPWATAPNVYGMVLLE